MKKILCIVLITMLFLYSCQKKEKIILNYSVLNAQAIEESLVPIRPGIPGESPFWNEYARCFIYVPSFNLKPMDGAVSYRFTAKSSINGKEYTFEAPNPWASLTPIWKDLPVGYVDLTVQGYDKTGKEIKPPLTKKFYRSAVFKGPYHKPVLDYKESARRALEYLFNLKHYQNWISEGKPDPSYGLYCYPSKIIGAVIDGMIQYSKFAPAEKRENALLIAKNAADYLIKISEPAGSPLEFFPPTYAGDVRTAKIYKGQVMMIYPVYAGGVYLNLYDVTKDKKYFDAAKKIADTYVKLQLPGGSWILKIDAKTGRPVKPNICIPISIINFFDRLEKQYGLNEYNKYRNTAFNWVMENPVKTFNWEGQFEDMEPLEPYKNLTKDDAVSVAGYLLGHSKENPEYIKLAEELLRYSENQFVVWENPMPQENFHSSTWITPSVLEQYGFYVPIDASASTMINAYLKAYENTKKEIYLAKAVALANTMTVAQESNTGRYPTYWIRDNAHWQDAGWINCATSDCITMFNLAEFLNKIKYDINK